MPRPFKSRCVGHVPGYRIFKPARIPIQDLTRSELHLDELEAIRLVDAEGLDQAQAAERMQVSRSTVGRILKRVRRKIALGLCEGHVLFIEDGAAPIERVRRK